MKIHLPAIAVILISATSSLLADDLTWGGTYTAAWQGYGTSPYTAIDNSIQPNPTFQIFCLDFNDEIAPPMQWAATILPLNGSNVSTYAQYGGNYNNLVAAAGGGATNDVSGPPFAFSGASAGPESVNLSQDNAYARYLAAAWLFTDIQSALANHDGYTALVAQAAAWDLFVNSSNLSLLTNDINGTGGAFSFTNYLVWSGANYLQSGTASAQTTSNPTFAQAVVVALAAAQNSVDNLGWGPGSNAYKEWTLVTGTPAFDVGYGRPVQEFLSPNAPDPSAVPEPQSFVLLGTAIAGVWMIRRRHRRPARQSD